MNYKSEKKSNIFIVLICLVFMIPISFSNSGCGFLVDEDQAVRAVNNMGFTEVRVESKHVFFLSFRGCSKNDKAGFTVVGRNPKGDIVRLLVCIGWPFKGATIRTI